MPQANPLKKIPVGEVLRLLFNDAHQRVNATKAPKALEVKDLAPNDRVRELHKQYRANIRWNKRLERQLHKRGVGLYHDGRLYVLSEVQSKATTEYTRKQAARLAALKRWRIDAHLDLVGLDVPATQAYLRALRTKLEAL